MNNNKRPTALTMEFNTRTRALYWLFWNAYTLKLNKDDFYRLFEKDLEDISYLELKLAQLFGLISKTPEGYGLTKRGAYLYHLMEQKYTHQYIDKTWRITGETPWPEEIKLY